jgi:hypothetical protein
VVEIVSLVLAGSAPSASVAGENLHSPIGGTPDEHAKLTVLSTGVLGVTTMANCAD